MTLHPIFESICKIINFLLSFLLSKFLIKPCFNNSLQLGLLNLLTMRHFLTKSLNSFDHLLGKLNPLGGFFLILFKASLLSKLI